MRLRARRHEGVATPTPEADAKAQQGSGAHHGDAVTGFGRMAGISGLAFAVLMVVAMVLVAQAPGVAAPNSTYANFYSSGRGSLLVTLGLYIVPFAGIAFLWYMSATRARLQALARPSTSDIQNWLQLASGVVFVCMLFAGTAAVGAIALLTVFSNVPLPSPEIARTLTSAGYGLVFVYGVRAAGMFMITTTTLARGTRTLPKWLGVLSYLAATFLLVSTTFHPIILMVFPAWIVLMSVVMLVGGHQSNGASGDALSSSGADHDTSAARLSGKQGSP